MSSSSKQIYSQLISITKCWPLRNLKPGSTFTIRSPSSPSLPIQVRLVPQWREDGHIQLHQILPPISNSSSSSLQYSDLDQEVDVRIQQSTKEIQQGQDPSSHPTHHVIDVTIDYKKHFTSPSISKTLSPPSVVPTFDSSSSISFDSSEPYHLEQETTHRYMTDEGTILFHPPSSLSSSSTSSQGESKSEEEENLVRHFQKVEYHDGITHLKTMNWDPNSNHNTKEIHPPIMQTSSTSTTSTSTLQEYQKNMQNTRPDPIITLTATIPEKCNVKCYLCPPTYIHDTHTLPSTTSSSPNAKMNHSSTMYHPNPYSSIRMENGKLEGEEGFDFITMGGMIQLTKLRGKSIQLTTLHPDRSHEGNCPVPDPGIIHVTQALEAQDLHVTVGQGGRFRAKMVHASHATIQLQDDSIVGATNPHTHMLDAEDTLSKIDISSIYTTQVGNGAHIVVSSCHSSQHDGPTISDSSWKMSTNPRRVRVNNSHGHVSVHVTTSDSKTNHVLSELPLLSEGTSDKVPMVELGGVNGSFDVTLQNHGSIQQYSTNDEHEIPLSTRIHIDSLSPNQVSILTSDLLGATEISMDRKIECDLRLVSCPLANQMHVDQLIGESDQDFSDMCQAHDSFVGSMTQPSNESSLVSGGDNTDNKPSRIQIQTPSFVGQTLQLPCLEYAVGHMENKSLEPDSRFDVRQGKSSASSKGKVSIDVAADQALDSFSGSGSGNRLKANQTCDTMTSQPLLAIASNGPIRLETVSWIGAIAKRYGVSDAKKGVGR